MSKGEIRAALKRGTEPQDLPGATRIGNGVDRTAYQVGSYVVKESSLFQSVRDDRATRKRIRRTGFRIAPTIRVKGPVAPHARRTTFDVQLKYVPARDSYPAIKETLEWKRAIPLGDLHGGNIGIDHRGRYVAFDW